MFLSPERIYFCFLTGSQRVGTYCLNPVLDSGVGSWILIVVRIVCLQSTHTPEVWSFCDSNWKSGLFTRPIFFYFLSRPRTLISLSNPMRMGDCSLNLQVSQPLNSAHFFFVFLAFDAVPLKNFQITCKEKCHRILGSCERAYLLFRNQSWPLKFWLLSQLFSASKQFFFPPSLFCCSSYSYERQMAKSYSIMTKNGTCSPFFNAKC